MIVKMSTYNVQLATCRGRWHRILQLLANTALVAFQGTQVQSIPWQGESPVRTEDIADFHVFHWHAPLESSAHSNTSTGVSIAWHKRIFRKSHLREVWSPPPELQGRAGAVLFMKKSFFHILAMSAYFPSSGSAQQRKDTVAFLLQWMQSVLDQRQF